MKMITVENLSKSFGATAVLKDISLSVEQGECVVIIGGSGSGKSVFLRCIEQLEIPDAGRILIGEEEITRQNVNQIRQSMGMVYQGFHLFEHMNVMDNITLAPMKLKGLSRQDAEKKACELLRMVGLENKKYEMPAVLSGGQKQRVAIARCLAMEPQVMLFDEPTSALDPAMVGEVLATMRLLAKRHMTMIIVTHEMTFAKEIGTKILYFDEHGIYEQGTPEEIFEHPKRRKTQAFIRKLKYFSYHIERKDFDLMRFYGGLRSFTERYGIRDRNANRLQLGAEELIYEMLSGAYEEKDRILLDISIEYSEADHAMYLRIECTGRRYNPFEADTDEDAHLGVRILKNMAESIQFTYENDRNRLMMKLQEE